MKSSQASAMFLLARHIRWSWDADGNIHAQTIETPTSDQTTFLGLTSGTNRLSSLAPTGGTTTTITSSSTGNLGAFTAGSTTLLSLGYNQANELSSAATTTSSATYAYDFRGQRLEKTFSGSNTVAYAQQHGADNGHHGEAAWGIVGHEHRDEHLLTAGTVPRPKNSSKRTRILCI